MQELKAFTTYVISYYKKSGRDLPWRMTRDPYRILVSEIMLQQTQVSRVTIKYEEFLKEFPTLQSLAQAKTADVLRVWKGLGYNRRALNLHRAAQAIMKDHKGIIPKNYTTLLSLPGIGKATAGDLLAFAWNVPVVVIETNIRSVFIHHFFKNKKAVHDRDIIPLIEATLDRKNPRDWYYALMDYGVMLKKTEGNASRKSAHYTKQSKFAGSNRESRSQILAHITKKPSTETALKKFLKNDTRITKNLSDLSREGFIEKRGQRWYIHGT